MTTKSDVSRVLRGGSWYDDAEDCRSAFRVNHGPSFRNLNIGFRVVRPVSVKLDAPRVVRGGSWSFNAEYCRSAYRDYYEPSNRHDRIGFRVVKK